MIGVLALQGDFRDHLDSLYRHGVAAKEVRSVTELKQCDALILPGGESTTIAKLLKSSGLDRAIIDFARGQRKPVWGTCAGAILLANKVISSTPLESGLGLLNMTVERNAYGRQADSFPSHIKIDGKSTEVFFIRAPKIRSTGKGVQVLADLKGEPVMVRSGRVLATTFHSEVFGENRVLEVFLTIKKEG